MDSGITQQRNSARRGTLKGDSTRRPRKGQEELQ
jgi:hypothetical protein